ncbi:MAG TPA: hypothetical protein VHV30_17880 [Polyangiaceae bacterium]|jgi:hypothetical protein|nr:hypothetical protein [Polyangiaceae bacterium]
MISGKQTDDVSGAARPAEGEFPPEGLPATGDDALEAEAGEAGTGLDEPDDPGPQAPAPPQVAELAAACVRFIASKYSAALDFRPETLSFVDHWVREARAEITVRPEAVELVQAAAGAYLGEVIRLAFGGSWKVEGHHADWRLQLERVYCSFNPIGMAREALLLEEADGWGAHFELDPAEAEGIEQRLAALPPAPDEEFYAPSTRFDVVAILFGALREGLRARGLSDTRFTPEDYTA